MDDIETDQAAAAEDDRRLVSRSMEEKARSRSKSRPKSPKVKPFHGLVPPPSIPPPSPPPSPSPADSCASGLEAAPPQCRQGEAASHCCAGHRQGAHIVDDSVNYGLG